MRRPPGINEQTPKSRTKSLVPYSRGNAHDGHDTNSLGFKIKKHYHTFERQKAPMQTNENQSDVSLYRVLLPSAGVDLKLHRGLWHTQADVHAPGAKGGAKTVKRPALSHFSKSYYAKPAHEVPQF